MGTGGSKECNLEKHIPGFPKSVKPNILEKILEQTKKSVCKILCNNGGNGTGFFCFLPFPDRVVRLRALITNNHILDKSNIEIGKTIEFTVNDDKKYFKIKIDESRKVYTNEIYDITIIELYKEKDGIKEDSYLEVDDIILDDDIKDNLIEKLKNKSVYLIHYPEGESLEHAEGVIQFIGEDKYTIYHACNSRPGSSGSPILSLENNKLIGIHKGSGKNNCKWNLGILLIDPIKNFNEKYLNNENNKNRNNENKKIEKKDDNFSLLSNQENIIFNNNIGINNNNYNIPNSYNNINIINNNKENNKNINMFNSYNNNNNNKNNNIFNSPNNNININNNINGNFNGNFKYVNENSLKIKMGNKQSYKSTNNNIEKNIVDEITIVYKKRSTNIKDFYYNIGVNLYMDETLSTEKFFGEKFVEKNKDKCKIIYKGKEYELSAYFKDVVNEDIEDYITIKLKGISKITDCTNMFFGCISLYSLPDIQNWDTKNITDMSSMFTYCRSLNPFPDISGWNTKNVKSFKNFFCYCREIEYLPDISKWDMSSAQDLSHMFDCCLSLQSFPDISNWNTFNVTNMSTLFASCLKVKKLPDISNWMTYNVKSMSLLFSECHSLIFIPDISKWNTDNVEDMSKLFADCYSLEVLPDISVWNTKNVKNMSKMFCGCRSLTSLPDILIWELNDSVVTENMFTDFSKVAIIDKIKWDKYKSKFKISSSIFGSITDTMYKEIFKIVV